MQCTDEAILLARAQRNDQQALTELYDRYAGKIYAYILYRVGDSFAAEDLTAAVFIKVLDAIRSDRCWQLSFSGWLYRIAHNAVIDHFRRSRKRDALPLDEHLVASGDDPVSSAEQTMTYEAMRGALAELTEDQQTVIQLKFYEGLSNLEVARVLGKTEGAIKSLQFRALGALRRTIEDQAGGSMPRRLETALDECLALMAAGRSVAECLERFPLLSGELEPLLRTAGLVQDSRRAPEPAPIALTRARNVFLAEVARRQQASQPAVRERSRSGWRPAFSPGLATGIITLVLLFGALGGGSMVSANSLPGDPLYGVKRASETVRLALTTDAAERDELQQAFAARRIEEVKLVIARHQSARVEFAGMVGAVLGQQAEIDGVLVDFTGQSVPELGAQVSVIAQTREDGSVQASAVTVEATPVKPTAAPNPAANLPTAKPTGQLKPTNTPQPSPTATEELKATATLSNTLIVSATAALTATATDSPTEMPSPTCTATMTPPPPPRDVQVRIEGQIDEITGGYWRVGGKQVFLAGTQVNQEKARAQVGGHAVVDALQKADGRLVALTIVVLRGPDQPPEAKEFSGRIDSISGSTWVVGGRTVDVSSATIDGEPRVGAQATIKADQYADGRLVARQITVRAPEEQVVHFGGIVQSFSDSQWVVAGQRVAVTGDTRISGDPQVGAIAEVEAVVQADGTRVAIKISVKAPPEPTATPSVVPTAQPTPEPTAQPTIEATAEPTATTEPTVSAEATETPAQVPGSLVEPTLPPDSSEGAFVPPDESAVKRVSASGGLAPMMPAVEQSLPVKTAAEV